MPFTLQVTDKQLRRFVNGTKATLTGTIDSGALTVIKKGKRRVISWARPLSFDLDDQSNAFGDASLMQELLLVVTDHHVLPMVSFPRTVSSDEQTIDAVLGLVEWVWGRLVVVGNLTNDPPDSHCLVFSLRTHPNVEVKPPRLIIVPALRQVLLYAALTGQYWPDKDG